MKIIHTFDPVPSRVIGLLRVLRHQKDGWTDRSVVVDLLQPAPIRGAQGTDPIMEVIAAAIELGVVLEDRTDRTAPRIRLADVLLDGNEKQFENALPRVLAGSAVKPECQGMVNEFAQATAWLLTQDPTAMPQGHGQVKHQLQADGLNLDELGLKNDQRWDMVLYWAVYLGLAWQTQKQKWVGVIPDPSTYLLRHLNELLEPEHPLPIHDFRQRLGERCPVLDGGVVHSGVVKRVNAARAATWNTDERISAALSFALRFLKTSGAIEYWCPDDQRTFLLMSGDEKIAFIARPGRKRT